MRTKRINRSQVKLGYLCNKLISHEKICIGCILSQKSPANVPMDSRTDDSDNESPMVIRLSDHYHLFHFPRISTVARVVLRKKRLLLFSSIHNFFAKEEVFHTKSSPHPIFIINVELTDVHLLIVLSLLNHLQTTRRTTKP